MTCFHYLVVMYKLYIETLIRAGTDVNISDRSGRTPLHEVLSAIASLHGTKLDEVCFYIWREVVERLIVAGADVNVVDKSGRTPLHEAVKSWRSDEFVETLIEAGANVNAVDESGRTPLHEVSSAIASLHGAKLDQFYLYIWCEVVETLIAAGADVNVVDKGGETPLDIARRTDNYELISILRSAGAKTRPQLLSQSSKEEQKHHSGLERKSHLTPLPMLVESTETMIKKEMEGFQFAKEELHSGSGKKLQTLSTDSSMSSETLESKESMSKKEMTYPLIDIKKPHTKTDSPATVIKDPSYPEET